MDLKLMEKKCDIAAQILKAMSHPKRLLILCHLSEHKMCVTDIENASGLSQSQTSQFLKRLELEGLIRSEREGAFVYYEIADENVSKLLKSMNGIFCKT